MRLRWATIALLVVAWEVACRTLVRSDDYLAPPSEVLTTGSAYLAQPDTVAALTVTTTRFLAAFAVTALLGVAVGLALGRTGCLVPAARDMMTVLYTLPLVPFYPLFVLWFGLGFRSEVAFGAIHGAVPVVLGTMAAASRVDETLITATRAMGAGRTRTLTMVVLPATVPDVVGSLRIGAALSLLGVLLAELMVSVDGVGHLIAALIANLRGPELDAVILAVCVGAVAVNVLLQAGERRLSRWREQPTPSAHRVAR
ncbi:ABC transporter permease [Paractinoplanes durhamensis]|uniref:Taurine ABC transporter permease n=1 Tax=Paractinoplanes durhamensis TaxID=113563 RepID=A0ABQ3ZAZ6_9ACTN|nr:ABC transporter permease subunit [Actinoplanes durhamensis]GIE06984.1 taurine ABC transporter permease [Actinoplanes durhamensis]